MLLVLDLAYAGIAIVLLGFLWNSVVSSIVGSKGGSFRAVVFWTAAIVRSYLLGATLSATTGSAADPSRRDIVFYGVVSGFVLLSWLVYQTVCAGRQHTAGTRRGDQWLSLITAACYVVGLVYPESLFNGGVGFMVAMLVYIPYTCLPSIIVGLISVLATVLLGIYSTVKWVADYREDVRHDS